MKILMPCYEFPPLGGGGAKVVDGLSAELVRQGHEVEIVTMGFRDLPRYEEVNGVKVHRVACLRRSEAICSPLEMVTYIVSAFFKVLKLSANGRYDIIHPHFIFPDGITLLMLKLLKAKRFIVTAHGSDVPGYNPDRFKLLHVLLAPFWQMTVRSADSIVCPSDSLRERILRACSSAKTCLIPNGFDIDRLTGKKPKQKRILVVSRMFERKGVQYFLKALVGLDHQHEVHVVGDGPYLPELRKMAEQDGINVKFWGWVDNESPELADLYETSEIFVFTSEAENFPIVLLEAMAAGSAIITTDGTGCAEVVGETGRLVEPKNSLAIREALAELTGNPDLCRAMGQSARRRLEENFSWQSVARRYVELYTSRDRLAQETVESPAELMPPVPRQGNSSSG